MAELTKEQKKAVRKEKLKTVIKKVGPYALASIASGAFGAWFSYSFGKHKGYEQAIKGPEVKLIANVTAYDAIEDFRRNLLKCASEGDFASQFTSDKTGEHVYLVYNVSKEAPEWWGEEGTETFDLAEKVMQERDAANGC